MELKKSELNQNLEKWGGGKFFFRFFLVVFFVFVRTWTIRIFRVVRTNHGKKEGEREGEREGSGYGKNRKTPPAPPA